MDWGINDTQDKNEHDSLVNFIGNFDFRKSDQGIVLVRCIDDKARQMNIPSDVLGARICAIADKAFERCHNLHKIVIPDGVEVIGERAFGDCHNLEFISLGSGVTSIGRGAFENCLNLKKIEIPDTVAELGEDLCKNCEKLSEAVINADLDLLPNGVFCGCVSLEKVFLTENITKLGDDAFRGCVNLRQLSLPTRLINIGNSTFKGCEQLEDLVFPINLNEIAESAFDNCSSFETVRLPNNLEKLGSRAFCNCNNLTNIYIGNKLHYVGVSAFSGCSNIINITLPANIDRLESRVFCDCVNLREIDLSSCRLEYIGSRSFSGCKSLERVYLPNCLSTIKDGAFENCQKLESIDLPDSVVKLEKSCFEGCTALKRFHLPQGVTYVPDRLCLDCYNLKDLDLGEQVIKVGAYAFSGCCALEKLYLPGSLKSLSPRSFAKCTNLLEVKISEGLHFIGKDAFAGCRNLERINLPGSVKIFGNDKKYEDIFDPEANNLVIVGNANTEARKYASAYRIKFYDLILNEFFEGDVETSQGAEEAESFDEGYVLEDEYLASRPIGNKINIIYIRPNSYGAIVLKDGRNAIRHKAYEKKADTRRSVPVAIYLENINVIGNRAFCNRYVVHLDCGNMLTSIGKSAFWGCVFLQKIDWSMNLKVIDKCAFWGCKSLRSVNLPSSVENIDNWAFFACANLGELKLSENLISIGDYTFAYCTNLKLVVIPEGTRSIGLGAFSNCPSLEKVVIPPSVHHFGNNISGEFAPIFGQCNVLAQEKNFTENLLIICEEGSVAHEYAKKYNLRVEFKSFTTKKSQSNQIGVKRSSQILAGLGMSFQGLDSGYKKAEETIPSTFERVENTSHDLNLGSNFVESLKRSYKQVINSGILSSRFESEEFDIWRAALDVLSAVQKGRIWEEERDVDKIKQTLNSSKLFYSINEILRKSLYSVEDNDNVEDNLSQESQELDVLRGAVDTIEKALSLVESNEEKIWKKSKDEVTLAKCPHLGKKIIQVPDTLEDGRVVTALADGFLKGDEIVEEVYLGENLLKVGKEAFRSCKSLKKINLPEGLKIVDNDAFRSCTSLKEFVLPRTVTYLGDHAFCACDRLNGIVLSELLEEIGDFAFADCVNLEELLIPGKVISLGSGLLFGCRRLRYLGIPSTCVNFGKLGDSKLIDFNENLTVLTPEGSPAWNYFSSLGVKCEDLSADQWREFISSKEVMNEHEESTGSVLVEEVVCGDDKENKSDEKKSKYLKRQANIKRKRR